MEHVMLDKETLATTADAVIISIGAVKFDLDTGKLGKDGFYASVSIDSNLELGRRISESTLLWWMQQPPAAQEVFREPKQTLESALIAFADWFGDATYIWSNGADFDIPMMAHAYRQLGMDAPWQFYNTRCVRTYKTLPGVGHIERPQVGVRHNALDDAINQALLVQRIHEFLTKGKVTA